MYPATKRYAQESSIISLISIVCVGCAPKSGLVCVWLLKRGNDM